MTEKSFRVFLRRMVRANAWRQASSGIPFGQEPLSQPIRIDAGEAAGIEINIEFRVDGVPVAIEPDDFPVLVAHETVSGRDGDGLARAASGARRTGLETEPSSCRSRTRDAYREMGEEEKRQVAIDLVAGGPEALSAHAKSQLTLLILAGRVTGGAAPCPRLRFEPAWPASLAGRELDLYNVLLASSRPGRKERRVLLCERLREHEGLEVRLEGEGERIWGILAVDPENGRGRIRRLAFRVPQNGGRL
jgi:hypothetical protein